jgi:5-methylcytosine-specific restriction endonuclease McrBC regulatory subunit McrC
MWKGFPLETLFLKYVTLVLRGLIKPEGSTRKQLKDDYLNQDGGMGNEKTS